MTEYQKRSFSRLHKLLNLADSTDIRELAQYFALFDSSNASNFSIRNGTRIANIFFNSGIKTIGDFRQISSSKIIMSKYDGKLQKIASAAHRYFPHFLLINTEELEEKKHAYLLNDYDDIDILNSLFEDMASIILSLKIRLHISTIGQFMCLTNENLSQFKYEDAQSILRVQENIDIR